MVDLVGGVRQVKGGSHRLLRSSRMAKLFRRPRSLVEVKLVFRSFSDEHLFISVARLGNTCQTCGVWSHLKGRTCHLGARVCKL